MDDGYTVHVGSEQSYLALYTNSKMLETVNQCDKNPRGLCSYNECNEYYAVCIRLILADWTVYY